MGSFYEFFAGGGMARAGLAEGWRCLFANDFDHKKSRVYFENWGTEALKVCDVRDVKLRDIPDVADLVWASFPCQDLSLAGGGAGLKGDRSGTFWPFWAIVRGLISEGRAPRIIVLENVCGTLNSHNGKDFAAICSTFETSGYRYGALVADAALFVPQCRPRLFMIGIRADIDVPSELVTDTPLSSWHTRALLKAHGKLDSKALADWLWWKLPQPPRRTTRFLDIIEKNPSDVPWHSMEETKELLDRMSALNLAKVVEAKRSAKPMIGTVYKRTRLDEFGVKVQRAEVRFDDVAGCLRTPAGGSSRQIILRVENGVVRSRLISSRETARLMGLSDDYTLPSNYNEAYHLTGDGVVVPVVRYLAKHLLEPLLSAQRRRAVA